MPCQESQERDESLKCGEERRSAEWKVCMKRHTICHRRRIGLAAAAAAAAAVSCVAVSCVAAFTFHPRKGQVATNYPFAPKRPCWRPETSNNYHRETKSATTGGRSPPSSMTGLFMGRVARPGNIHTDSDETEWKAVLASLKMYKAAYGDLKVPTKFVVPSMVPWPEPAWGLKLGSRVGAIRATGRFIQNNEKRRKLLEDLGFVWRVRSGSPQEDLKGITFDQTYDALNMFRKVEGLKNDDGSMEVPPNFVVPNGEPWPIHTRGLPLGEIVASMRTPTYVKNHPGEVELLESLGLELDIKIVSNDSRFRTLMDALRSYKQLHGDLLVPQPFVVPDNTPDFPEHTWGLRLGARVNAIRSQGTFVNSNPRRRQMLDDIGFVWSPTKPDRGRRGRRRQAEPDDGIVEGSRGAKDRPASSAMDTIFGPSADYDEDDSEFDEDDLDEDEPSEQRSAWMLDNQEIPEAQQQEKNPRPDGMETFIDPDYVEPKTLLQTLNETAKMAIEVGVLSDVSDLNNVKKAKRSFDVPWYNDDFGEDFVFEDVVEGFTIYKEMYGSFENLTSYEFVIPSPYADFFGSDDGEDNFDIGASARAAAAIADYEEQGRIRESQNLVASEIERLQQQMDGTESELETAPTMTLTKNPDVSWPEHLGGMDLGRLFKRIREGSLEVKHLPERKALLDAIDFDWGDEKLFIDIPFEKAMCAFMAYYQIRGDMLTLDDFVIPDSDPWPTVLAGYEVGKAATRIRKLQHFFETYHPEKLTLLRAIEFAWFPSMALPLDPNEGELSLEMKLVFLHGHPDYALPKIPPGLFQKIVEEGPYYETDDPKMWWRKYHSWEHVKGYWYDLGLRDNAYRLFICGFPTLSAEHEAKYGPGILRQIFTALDEIFEKEESMSEQERREYFDKVTYFLSEMEFSRDLDTKSHDRMMGQLELAKLLLLDGLDDARVSFSEDEFEDAASVEEEVEDGVVEEIEYEQINGVGEVVNGASEPLEYEVEEEEYVDGEINIEDELGLANKAL